MGSDKIIISQDRRLDRILELYENCKTVTPSFLSILIVLHASLGIQLISDGKFTLNEFLRMISVIIPFSDVKLLKFKTDRLKDADRFSDQLLNQLYLKFDGRLGGPQSPRLSFEKFVDALELPDAIIDELIAAYYELQYWHRSLPKDVDLLQYFSIDNFKLIVMKNAREDLIQKLTVYASAEQEKFFDQACALLASLSDLEKKYKATGLIQKGLTSTGSGYVVRPELLIQIQ